MPPTSAQSNLNSRLTGVYAFVCLFHMTLLRVFQGGPLESIPSLIKVCRDSWWRSLFYVTNYEFSYVENTESVSTYFPHDALVRGTDSTIVVIEVILKF